MKNVAQRTDRIREQRARRTLRSHGLLLRKSRSESDSYWITDPNINAVVLAGDDLTLEQVEHWLEAFEGVDGGAS